MKNVVLLGSTGSIGTSTAMVAGDLPDDIRLVGLAAGSNTELLAKQSKQFRPELVSIGSPEKAAELRLQLDGIRVACGDEGLIELATLPSADIVLIAIVGTAGLQPALAAIRAGKDIAVASKEILVMAGEIVMAEARKHGVQVLPVDSEHSAIFQCLDGRAPESVRRLDSHRIRRAVPRDTDRGVCRHHRRAGAQASVVGDGPQDYHRLGDDV